MCVFQRFVQLFPSMNAAQYLYSIPSKRIASCRRKKDVVNNLNLGMSKIK